MCTILLIVPHEIVELQPMPHDLREHFNMKSDSCGQNVLAVAKLEL